jgi:hypothetical protein
MSITRRTGVSILTGEPSKIVSMAGNTFVESQFNWNVSKLERSSFVSPGAVNRERFAYEFVGVECDLLKNVSGNKRVQSRNFRARADLS